MPAYIEFKEPVLQVACGGFHTAVLTDSGRVYTWGDGRMGQLGNLARKHNMLATPHLVDRLATGDVHVVEISCGQYHTACISSRGEMFSWGSGKYGQLGHATRLDERYPRRVETEAGLGGFLHVSCGDRHTAAVTRKLQVVTFGSGQHGQLGHGVGTDYLKPKLVESLLTVRVVSVTAGATNTCAITDEGELYLWGFGESIHPKHMNNIVETPRVVRMRERVKQVACGQSHILVLTESGDVYAFGSSAMGQLGHGTRSSVRYPRLILRGKHIEEIAAGRYHSMAVTNTGVLLSWGCGESGQLAHNSLENEMFPRVVEAILPNVVGQICSGEHHSFCLSSIEHASVRPDLAVWKMVEDAELSLKKSMLNNKDYPDASNGLKTKHILLIEQQRKRIEEEILAKIRRDKLDESKYLQEQVQSIESPAVLDKEITAAQRRREEAAGLTPSPTPGQQPGGAGAKIELVPPSGPAVALPLAPSVSIIPPSSTGDAAGGDEAASPAARKNTRRIYATGTRSSPGIRTRSVAGAGHQSPRNSDNGSDAGGHHAHGDDHALESARGAGGALHTLSSATMPAPSLSPLAGGGGAGGRGAWALATAPPQGLGSASAATLALPVANSSVAGAGAMAGVGDGVAAGGAAGAAGASGVGGTATAGLVSGAAAPRPLSAMEDASPNHTQSASELMAFQPLVPRMAFMEKTTATLQKVKKSLQSGQMKLGSSPSTQELFVAKKQYNELRSVAKHKAKLLESLRNAYLFMRPTEEDNERVKANLERIRDLNMKLVTLNTRLMEADENKKNYELYIIRMKEEDVQLSKQIDHLRHLVVEYDRLLAKMDKMNSRVSNQKKEIDEEIVRFQSDIQDFARFAREQLQRYQEMIAASAAEARLQSKLVAERESKMDEKRTRRLEKLQQEFDNAADEASEIKTELESWQERVRFYEQRFHKITAATGLSHPQDIINKFFFNDEITEDLNREIKQREKKLEETVEARSAMQAALEEKKTAFVQSKWRDVEQLQAKLEQSALSVSKNRDEVEHLLQKLVLVKEGVAALCATVDDRFPPDKPAQRIHGGVEWSAGGGAATGAARAQGEERAARSTRGHAAGSSPTPSPKRDGASAGDAGAKGAAAGGNDGSSKGAATGGSELGASIEEVRHWVRYLEKRAAALSETVARYEKAKEKRAKREAEKAANLTRLAGAREKRLKQTQPSGAAAAAAAATGQEAPPPAPAIDGPTISITPAQ